MFGAMGLGGGDAKDAEQQEKQSKKDALVDFKHFFGAIIVMELFCYCVNRSGLTNWEVLF